MWPGLVFCLVVFGLQTMTEACSPPFTLSNTTTTNGDVQKRWFITEPTPAGYQLWANGQIPFKMNMTMDVSQQTQAKRLLNDAFDLWVTQGLRTVQLIDLQGSNLTPDRQNFLLVSSNPGFSYADTGRKTTYADNGGPNLNISPSLLTQTDPNNGGTTEYQEILAEVAHELGHVMGLFHEHQRPDLWTRANSGTGSQDVFRFDCTRLPDYTQFTAAQQRKMCMNMVFAWEVAAETGREPLSLAILPEMGGFDYQDKFPNTGIVDAGSIMLYNTEDLNGVLRWANGNDIQRNLVPSSTDVAGVHLLYPPPPAASPTMYWDAGPNQSRWNRLAASTMACGIPPDYTPPPS